MTAVLLTLHNVNITLCEIQLHQRLSRETYLIIELFSNIIIRTQSSPRRLSRLIWRIIESEREKEKMYANIYVCTPCDYHRKGLKGSEDNGDRGEKLQYSGEVSFTRIDLSVFSPPPPHLCLNDGIFSSHGALSP